MKSGMFKKMASGMAVCCILPAVIVMLVSATGIASGNRIIAAVTPFLCPIMMMGMMFFMGKEKNNKGHLCCNDKENTEENI
ncbi:hypothetical protein OXPF_07300 [Oxobacter pfennigii]|uniref:DUF2933 domain-containing protein n=1 Tax=Oxobacter pfennigii TaxID=36849 RepID=A0A0P8WA60_9CLOT|nr:hypothetical protein [Oxobacter pfennigii]KPU45497.1 hypothetical protein OXPF_07300 [Oxobacter pfennigii]